MGTTSRCRIRMLARSELCAVEYCPGCGMFHVTLGMVTLRFKLAALHRVTGTLTAGLEAYKRQQKGSPAKVLPFRRPEDQVRQP